MAIKRCTCEHEYQNKRHGKGKRVMNETRKSNTNNIIYRCTVCGRETN